MNFFEQTTLEMQINILTLSNKRTYSKLKYKIEFREKWKLTFSDVFSPHFLKDFMSRSYPHNSVYEVLKKRKKGRTTHQSKEFYTRVIFTTIN